MDDPFVALERELSRLFRRAHGASHEISTVAHPDLDSELYTLLAYIDRHPGSLAKNIVVEFRQDPGTVSRQLSRAEAAGHINRSPDPNDSRGMVIELTPEGRSLFLDARDARTLLVRTFLQEWPQDDVSTLAGLLQRLLNLDGAWMSEAAESMLRERAASRDSLAPRTEGDDYVV
jgi:DNA-binding MarR family transcriptional regulator